MACMSCSFVMHGPCMSMWCHAMQCHACWHACVICLQCIGLRPGAWMLLPKQTSILHKQEHVRSFLVTKKRKGRSPAEYLIKVDAYVLLEWVFFAKCMIWPIQFSSIQTASISGLRGLQASPATMWAMRCSFGLQLNQRKWDKLRYVVWSSTYVLRK